MVSNLEAATGPELAVTAAEHGKRISVRVTGAKDEPADVTEESAPTLRVAHLERPGMAGVPAVLETRGHTGSWTDEPAVFSCRWRLLGSTPCL
ncbi:hypothetical protein [Micropruina sonneratiae]|uniref:hypothetical protein n=1 Tax=Micropruina sonneratiae TaxID=2986940 RepID=UPI00222724FD|nr:hypothetical protein [Micropruina sp. KQZ13P-5]MCW3159140.1 hypothetical protein [Micropruina sp. KQZ13P-5]